MNPELTRRMKLALLSLLVLAPAAVNADYLDRSAETLADEARALDDLVRYRQIDDRAQNAVLDLRWRAEQLVDCERQADPGSPYDPYDPYTPPPSRDRARALCSLEATESLSAASEVEYALRDLAYRNANVSVQLDRVQRAADDVRREYDQGGVVGGPIPPSYPPAYPPLPPIGSGRLIVVSGSLDGASFSFSATELSDIQQQCLQFGRYYNVYTIRTILVNGQVIHSGYPRSLQQACEIVTARARSPHGGIGHHPHPPYGRRLPPPRRPVPRPPRRF